MEFFDKLGESLVSAGKDVGQRAKDVSEIAKLKIDIKSKEDYVQKKYADLGAAYFEKHKNDEDCDDREQLFLIQEALDEIERMKAEVSITIVVTVTRRFIFIEFVFPLLLFFLTYKTQSASHKLNKRVVIGLMFVILCAGTYGIISELIKLNLYYGGQYTFGDLMEILQSNELIEKWLFHQSYRLFDIWTRLGANIIQYADSNGYFWGLSYIKFLSPFFGFQYISLPDLSAKMIGASYAQPGLVAEGYANFGIVGSIISISIVFFLIEFTFDNLLRKQTMRNLLLYISPFTQILLDGGTFMSAVVIILYVYITFFILQIFGKVQFHTSKSIQR